MQTRIFSGFAAIIAVSVGVAAWSPGAQAAAITGSSANVQIIAAPSNVQEGAVELDEGFSVFEEQTVLVSGLNVSATTVGDQFVGGSNTPGAISGLVTSFFVHYDPVSSDGLLTTFGFLEFDGPIVGLIWQQSLLTPSDAIVGAIGTTYTPQAARDYESGADQVIFTSLNRVDFQALAGGSVDSFRVLIAATAVPEPGALAVFGLGLAALAFARRRRSA